MGGHVVAALHRAGVDVVVLDDLSTGRADRLPRGVPLVRARVGDRAALRRALTGAAGVVHLAALTSAPDSVRDPLAYSRADVATLLTSGWRGSAVYNVGTGAGCSVLQLLSAAARGTGGPVPWVAGPARPGDPASSVADPALIARELGWRPRRDLAEALGSAWAALRGPAPVSRPPVPLAAAG